MFVGRQKELSLIQESLENHNKKQMIILYGRRRVGKTRLIRESIKNEKNVLFFEGIQGEKTSKQLDGFLDDLSIQTKQIKKAAQNWHQAFRALEETVSKNRWVIVIDELPWLAINRSQLISELKVFWDRLQNDKVALFLCGSIASFMVKHIVHSKALHNRKTLEIFLDPLSPQESAHFIKNRGLQEKANMYMTFGGIPKYLEQIDSAHSLSWNTNKLCLSKNGFFVSEFETIFKEQFRASRVYENIVKLLAKNSLSITEISQMLKLSKSGGLLSYLDNLVSSQFIRKEISLTFSGLNKSKTQKYKLWDPFLLFYFRFIEPNKKIITLNNSENLYPSLIEPNKNSYYGFAFERLCIDSVPQILKKLGLNLSDLRTFGSYFQQKSRSGSGVQFDLIFMHRDPIITLIEIKHHHKAIGLSVIQDMEKKIESVNFPKNISLEKVLISANGVTKAVKNKRYFSKVLDLHDLID